jgi:hypothetical protein
MTEFHELTPDAVVSKEQACRDKRRKQLLRTFLAEMVYLVSAAGSHENWLPEGSEESMLREAAIAHWYRDHH